MVGTTSSPAQRHVRPLVSPLAAGPLLAGMIALVVYARTLPPGLTWANQGADGGDLLTAALTGGVPHPTGYPVYQLLMRLVVALAPSNPARAGAWFSAACAALAVALLADLARRQLAPAATGRPLTLNLAARTGAAAIGGLAWGVSAMLWGQATIVEVYALHALLCIALLWFSTRWLETVEAGVEPGPWPLLAGLALGLGLGNHLTFVLMLPGVIVLAWPQRRRLKQTGLRTWLAVAAGAAVGPLAYLYLPLAAANHAPVNWGDPRTLGQLLWVATGRLYAGLPFGLTFTQFASRVYKLAVLLVEQFTPWGLVLALFGLWRLDRRLHAWWRATLAIFLAYAIYAVGYASSDSLIYLIPAFGMMALWLAEGLGRLFDFALRQRVLFVAVAVVAVVALPVASLVDNWPAQDLSHKTDAMTFTSAVLQEAEPNAVILVARDERTFALWYSVYGLNQRRDLAIFNVYLYGYDWYRRALADTHPDLLPSVDTRTRVDTLITGWLKDRPVYVAEEIGMPLQLQETAPHAVLSKVLGLKQ